MIRESFDYEWEFGTGKYSFFGFTIDGQPEIVNLPHDFTIKTDPHPDCVSGASTGYYSGGLGCYTKRFYVPKEWKGQCIVLELDGAYMKSEVSVNGSIVGRRPYGYSPYHADLTAELRYGDINEIRIVVDNSAMPNSRWYSGSGIFRHIDLLCGSDLHISPWGIFARVENATQGNATLVVEVTTENASSNDRTSCIRVSVLDDAGNTVAASENTVTVAGLSKQKADIKLEVSKARLWDLDDPYLYTVKCELFEAGKITDVSSIPFGIRTISVDTTHGFRLNGKTLKLKGGCIHHDNGILGAAAFDVAEYRKMRIHKENGYNAVRCAHNPPSRGLLTACDRIGILVIDEAFDIWRMAKNSNDYHVFFDDWWERDLEAMVLRDRNHPSVIMWSIGNEVEERTNVSGGAKLAEEMAAFVRSLDPSRFVTAGVCGIFPTKWEKEEIGKGALLRSKKMQDKKPKQRPIDGAIQDFMDNDYVRENFLPKTEAFCKPLDIVGYNYLDYLYEKSAEVYPSRVICGTESLAMKINEIWATVEQFPHVIGDFAWVSHDYLGEAGVGKVSYSEAPPSDDMMFSHQSKFPWRTANNGDFDLCGFDRPQLHYRKIVWGSNETYLAVRNPKYFRQYENLSAWAWSDVGNKWTWNGYENMPIAVDIYSAAQEVELIVNGTSLGRKPVGKANGFKTRFETVYVAGKIEAVSYNEDTEISRDTLYTVGMSYAIRLSPEKTVIAADGQDLCYVIVEVVDEHGSRVPDAKIKMNASVVGNGTLAAFGSANPITAENYTIGSFTSYEGRLLAIIRSGQEQGTATLTVSAEGFESATTMINIY